MKEDEIIRQYGSVQEFIRETERKLLEKHDLEELCFFYERFKQYYPETFRVKPRRRSRYKKQIPFWSRLGLNEKSYYTYLLDMVDMPLVNNYYMNGWLLPRIFLSRGKQSM